MEPEIKIDIARYYRTHRKKPSGRGYWSSGSSARSPRPRITFLAPQEELAFKDACQRAYDVAALRRAVRIELLPE